MTNGTPVKLSELYRSLGAAAQHAATVGDLIGSVIRSEGEWVEVEWPDRRRAQYHATWLEEV